MVKIIPLGGMSVTKNMFMYETDEEILLVDCGIGFPDETMLGVDLLIPDTTYLENSKKRIVGMLLTHGHDDHIAGLPYILPKLPEFPMYASRLTAAFAAQRMKEFGMNRKLTIIDDERGVRLGQFIIESIRVTHSVPDARHFFITTPEASIYHGSDFKFDLTPVDNIRPEFQKIATMGRRGVTLMLSDCLRSERFGFSPSESTLSQRLESEIRDVKGKVIFTIMSSNVHRIQQAVDAAIKFGRRVALFGRSIEENVRVAEELGYLTLPSQALVWKKKISHVPDDKLCLIVAGSQGQPGSALVRAAQGEHENIKVRPTDKIIFSSDAIPGNERAVYETIDAFSHQGAEVIYADVEDNGELHVSGHGSQGELMLLMELVRPDYLVPIGGTYRHMVQYRKLASRMGYAQEKVFLLEEGQTIEVKGRREARIGETIPLKNIMVDGLGIGDVGKVVLRDRKQMSEEGILVVIIPVDAQTSQISGSVEIISRGLVYMKESGALLEKAKGTVASTLREFRTPIKEWRTVKDRIKAALEKLFLQELERYPMIIPIIFRM